MIYDRAARLTSTERWLALMLAAAVRGRSLAHATVAAEILHQAYFAASADAIYVATYHAALFATACLRSDG